MPRRSGYPSSAELKRIIAATLDAGIAVEAVEVKTDGTIRVMSATAAEELVEDEYERWKRLDGQRSDGGLR